MKLKRVSNIIGHAIFWLWNIAFLLIVYAGILPKIGRELISATFTGELPSEFFISFVALIAVPTICTLVGWWCFRKQSLQLLRLFYGVETPLFLLCLIRLFLLRELTPASTQIVGTFVVCIVAFLFNLLYGYIGQHKRIPATSRRSLAWLQLVCHSLMLLVGLYAGVVLLFYAVPVSWVVLQQLFKLKWLAVLLEMFTWYDLASTWWLPIYFLLFCFSSTLFVVMPSLFGALYLRSGHRMLKAFAAEYGRNRMLGGSISVVVAWLAIFLVLQQQPQTQAFVLLKNPAQTDSTRQALLAKSNVIRSGLVNAYLSSYRYLSIRKENDHIREIYKNVFGLAKSDAQVLQNLYNQLMSPFLYNGSGADAEKATKLYAEFFDAPIQKAEQEAIQHALQSTVNRGEAKAGLLDINQKKVWLRSQQITLKPQGDWADVELYEVYENQTYDVQEVFYSFSLPESAVITGVWSGDSDNRQKRFPFIVSPRGAAQKVYAQQVRRQQDPILIEQVGSRHYRLRAFPVPPKPSEFRDKFLPDQPKEMHLWLTYKVMQQEAGWAMPQLGEKRNIFWTKDTKRIYNGQAVNSSEDWLPSFIRADGKLQPTWHQVNLPGGYRISVKPLSNKDYSLPQGKRFAVVLDSSRSMASHTKELSQTFRWLNEKGFADSDLANNDADLYITASVGIQPQRIDDLRRFDVAMTFYGSLQPKQILQQFAQLRSDTLYDAVLVVTDEGSYELSDDKTDVPAMTAPLWMVHVGGKLPPAYDDATLRAIQDSNGGVSTAIGEVMQRLATQAALGHSVVSVVDGYAWSMDKQPQGASIPAKTISNNGFEPVAARQLVLGLSKEKVKEQLTQLDTMHAVAKSFEIVTPYSSMIVLVNDQQRQALKQAEQQRDRFNRQVENGNKQLTKPFNPLNVSGVPEPEEWMLLALVAIALLFIRWRSHTSTAKLI